MVDVEEDSELEKALRLSLGQEVPKIVDVREALDSDDEEQLRQALLLSLQTPDELQSTSSGNYSFLLF